MSFGRITAQTSLQANLRIQSMQAETLATLQEQSSSQKRILKPSDDPAGTAKAISIRAALAQNDQYSRNANDAQGWLTTADSALTQSTQLLQRVRDLTVQGANGTISTDAKAAIVTEIGQIKSQMLAQADTKYLGRSVFAGTSSATSVYDATTYAFSGVPGDSVTRLVGQNQKVQVDANGAAAFGQGPTSVFAELDSISASISSGTGVAAQLGVIDSRIQSVLQVQAQVGSSEAAVTSAQSTQMTNKTNLTADQSAVEDVDFASTYMQLQSAQNVQTASLAVLAKLAKSPQLQDYLP